MSQLVRSTSHRLLARGATVAGAVAFAAVALPGAASAHVTVQPGSVPGGGFSVVSFRVPNERDDASTTRLRVLLPKDQPIASVQTTPVPGWTARTATRTLSTPLDFFGEQVDTVVSSVVWTANGAGVRPGEFQDFDLSLGQLPASGALAFSAQQTYSDGQRVDWNEVAAAGTAEPEHPAPTLTLSSATAAADAGDQGAAGAGDASSGVEDTSAAVAPASTRSASGSVLPTVLAGAALVVSLLSALLVWRRRPHVTAEQPVERPLHETRV